MMQRWPDAHAAYAAAANAAPKNFESIPRSNAALASYELDELARAEQELRTLLRRDPAFVDGVALQAVIAYTRGDVGAASAAYASVCETRLWCERYATADAVLGRWPPRAVAAFERLLEEPAIRLARKNARALSAR